MVVSTTPEDEFGGERFLLSSGAVLSHQDTEKIKSEKIGGGSRLPCFSLCLGASMINGFVFFVHFLPLLRAR
jgi:hypothetical protein